MTIMYHVDIFVTQIKRADICSIEIRSLKEADYNQQTESIMLDILRLD